MRRIVFAVALSALTLVAFSQYAIAVWQQAGGTAVTYGTVGSVPATFDPSDPNNTGGDGGFQGGTVGGRAALQYEFNGCCTVPPTCPEGFEPGVKVTLSTTRTSAGGSNTTSSTKTCCPQTCCKGTVTVSEPSPGAWGGPATGCSVSATVECICCQGETRATNPTWPDHEYGSTVLTLMP